MCAKLKIFVNFRSYLAFTKGLICFRHQQLWFSGSHDHISHGICLISVFYFKFYLTLDSIRWRKHFAQILFLSMNKTIVFGTSSLLTELHMNPWIYKSVLLSYKFRHSHVGLSHLKSNEIDPNTSLSMNIFVGIAKVIQKKGGCS